MKIRALIVFMLLSVAMATTAQENLSVIDSYLDKLRRDKGLVSPGQLEYKDIQGTPYLDDLFRPGSLQMKSGNTLTGEFRYDIFADRIEFKSGEEIFHIAIPDSVMRLFTKEATISFLHYSDKEGEKKGYFIALYEGHYSVYEKRTKVFQKEQPPQPYQDAPIPAQFQDAAPAVYMKVGDQPAFRVGSLNDIIANCGKESDQAREYIRKNKVRFRDNNALADLFRHINGSITR